MMEGEHEQKNGSETPDDSDHRRDNQRGTHPRRWRRPNRPGPQPRTGPVDHGSSGSVNDSVEFPAARRAVSEGTR